MPPFRLPCLLLFAICLFLAGCGGEAATVAHFTPPEKPGGRLCVSECGQGRTYCRQSCDLDRRACTTTMQKRAIEDYEIYVRDQFRERQPLELRPRDFERPQTCAPAECYKACDRSHQSCYENCGGTVSVDSSCLFLCF